MPLVDDKAGSPLTIIEISVLVPPISKGTKSPAPIKDAPYLLPATPPAGPDRTVAADNLMASSIGATPP